MTRSTFSHFPSSTFRRSLTGIVLLTACVWLVPSHAVAQNASEVAPLKILVMDPLAAPLSCACVPGRGQRDYEAFGEAFSLLWKRPVEIVYEESLTLAFKRFGREIDLVIGKATVIQHDSEKTRFPLSPLVRMTDWDGHADLHGVFLVPKESRFQTLSDLKSASIVLGPEEDCESHVAAINRLKSQHTWNEENVTTASSLEAAAYAVADGEADVAVIPHYLPELLEGCGKVEKGSLRILGATATVPFVTVFASDELTSIDQRSLQKELLELNRNSELLTKLESKSGFVSIDRSQKQQTEWVTWRGPDGNGTSAWLPEKLPVHSAPNGGLEILWSAVVTGPALSGLAATEDYVLTADKDLELEHDVYRCFDAKTGVSLWNVSVAAADKVEYTNAPRAMPIVIDDLVYFQGALGDLICVELVSGKIRWQTNLLKEFRTRSLTWGSSSPPLIEGQLLITNPGAKEASLVALDRFNGKTVWKTPGHAAAYSSFVTASFGGIKQAVGYDSAGLGGWNMQTGERLWELIPPLASDFNVATPLVWQDKILLATENNGTRLYEFRTDGTLNPDPIALNSDAAPDTSTPVIIDDRVFVTAYGQLFCLDLEDNLKTLWVEDNDLFFDHCNLITGNHRVLIFNTTGELILIHSDSEEYEVVSQQNPFGADTETMSHPAIVSGRLYVRNDKQLLAISLETKR